MSTFESTATLRHCLETLAWRIVHVVIHSLARLLGLVMEVQLHQLSNSDCERLGLPYGSVDPDVFVFPCVTATWHRFDVWMEAEPDGSRCLNLDFLKHHGEIHFAPKRVSVGVPNGR